MKGADERLSDRPWRSHTGDTQNLLVEDDKRPERLEKFPKYGFIVAITALMFKRSSRLLHPTVQEDRECSHGQLR